MGIPSLIARAAACVALAAGASSCSVGGGVGGGIIVEPLGPGEGRLTVLWTVDGTVDPNACAFYGADQLEMLVYDRAGFLVFEAREFCEFFELSVNLQEGDYFADLTLVDFYNMPVSGTLPLDGLRIFAGTELTIDVDFPLGF